MVTIRWARLKLWSISVEKEKIRESIFIQAGRSDGSALQGKSN